jgi:RNA methyltransferase, TrmH family
MRAFEKITSRDNSRLVSARKVRDGKDTTRIFVEGRRLVEEALRSPLVFEECYVSESFAGDELIKSLAERIDTVIELPDKIFATIADTSTPQGIVVIAKRPESLSDEIGGRLFSGALPIVVFLKEINNPSNLGAILRTAEAANIAGVIVSRNSADVYSPRAIRGSMGACFRFPVWQNVSCEDVTAWSNERNLIVTASDISATKIYTEADWKMPRLLIFGSEAHGLDENELAAIDEKILIPMANDVESLNLAVSAGIILFEAKRQNG